MGKIFAKNRSMPFQDCGVQAVENLTKDCRTIGLLVPSELQHQLSLLIIVQSIFIIGF